MKAAKEEGLQIQNHDVVVVAQKIVSKAEGRVVNLQSITPSTFANAISKTTGKDPRHVETILRETSEHSENEARTPHCRDPSRFCLCQRRRGQIKCLRTKTP